MKISDIILYFNKLSNSGTRNANIQGLRGLCALVVFFGHVLCVYNMPFILNNMNKPIHLLWDGSCAVVVFFTLSGFFYFNFLENTPKQLLHSLINRYLRIAPPYFVSLTIGAVLINTYLAFDVTLYNINMTEWIRQFWKEGISFIEYFKQASIIFRSNTDMVNPPSWYLTCELKMMIIWPFIIFIIRKTHIITLIIFVVLSFMFSNVPLLVLTSTYALGFLSHLFLVKKKISHNKYMLVAIILVGLFLIDIRNFMNVLPLVKCFDGGKLQMIQGLGSALIILSLVILGKCAFLNNKLFLLIGKVSYEFFIIHFVVLLGLLPIVHTPIELILYSLTISLVVSILIREMNVRVLKYLLID